MRRVKSHFYETEFDIWAWFGQLGTTEIVTFEVSFFVNVFLGKTNEKIDFLYIVAFALKSSIKVRKRQFFAIKKYKF